MIALDANILLRYLVRDVPEQSELATGAMARLTRTNRGYVSREVLLELAWVLRRSYRVGRLELVDVLDGLLSTAELEIEARSDVAWAVEQMRERDYGFADLMISAAAQRRGCEKLLTFDRGAARLPGAELLQ